MIGGLRQTVRQPSDHQLSGHFRNRRDIVLTVTRLDVEFVES